MRTKTILFTKPYVAELLEKDLPAPANGQVQVKITVSTISSGTERSKLIGELNISTTAPALKEAKFPRAGGYSSAGRVVAVGEGVEGFAIDDRVAVFWAKHGSFMNVPAKNLLKLPDDVPDEEGALWNIATFPMAAIRKCRLEMGESALVMGQGVLGQMAVILLRSAGAVPIIAVDPVENKRRRALEIGADFALDPFDSHFVEQVKEITGGGAQIAIEVTGLGAGLNGALDCMRPHGRIALLGCTRNSDFTVDYYHKVHGPGITLIGAHTFARPEFNSAPGWFTEADDRKTLLDFYRFGRISLSGLIEETHKPEEAPEVYSRLAVEKSFPLVQFDWRETE